MKIVLFLVVSMMLLNVPQQVNAQTKSAIRRTKALFEGEWIQKNTKRHLYIEFQPEEYFRIDDWGADTQQFRQGDIYKAFIRQEKLIMPEDKEHRAPYSELLIYNRQLIYVTKFSEGKNKTRLLKEVFTKLR